MRVATTRHEVESALRSVGYGLKGAQLTKGIKELDLYVTLKPSAFQIHTGAGKLVWSSDSDDDLGAALEEANRPYKPRGLSPDPEQKSAPAGVPGPDPAIAKLEAVSKLRCNMISDCPIPATYTDGGALYCAKHAQQRSSYKRCRKLKPAEIRRMNGISDLR